MKLLLPIAVDVGLALDRDVINLRIRPRLDPLAAGLTQQSPVFTGCGQVLGLGRSRGGALLKAGSILLTDGSGRGAERQHEKSAGINAANNNKEHKHFGSGDAVEWQRMRVCYDAKTSPARKKCADSGIICGERAKCARAWQKPACRWRDSNPHGAFAPTDFKSVVSAISPHRLTARHLLINVPTKPIAAAFVKDRICAGPGGFDGAVAVA